MADRWLNEIIAGTRVLVENTIAGVKRCRIVTAVKKTNSMRVQYQG